MTSDPMQIGNEHYDGNKKPYQELLVKLQAVLGDHGLITDPSHMASYLSDWRNVYQGRSLAVARPSPPPAR